MPAARFGQMRLGLWTQHELAWMLAADWDALDVEPGAPEPGAVIALGFDGSVRRDSSALVAHEPATGRLYVLGHWKGEIPRGEVMATIDRAFTTHNVIALFADPWFWRVELQELAARLGAERVLEYNTASVQRMGPAADAFMASVLTRQLAWDGTPELRAHVLNAVARRTPAGDVIARDARRPRDTDLAIAAILAHEASRTQELPPEPAVW
jgi:phage terminase large subunit-like protein